MQTLWPRLLPPGGVIGICSPAGPSSAESLARTVTALEARGYRVRLAPNAAARDADLTYLGGSDDERVADLNGLLRDPEIDLILCARGGYGCARLLDRVDYAAARADPKPLVGYSDITALSLALAAKAGVVSFSGIMATAGHGFGEDTLDPWSEARFFDAVGESGAFPRRFARPDHTPWDLLRGPDTVTGPVVPVCLSLLVSLLGTPYVPDLTGAILVIEDVYEELYAVDRCLTQLRLAGVLDQISALLIGSFNGVSEEEDARLQMAVPRLAADLAPPQVAMASGVDYGHIARRLTLPVGATGAVDLRAGVFEFDNP
jgi:muramoyltetrapeptide carboxypeptidase